MAHGGFENRTGKCPHGCSERMVKKVFLKAPAYHNGTTARTDQNLKNLANDFGMTDFNNKNGTGPAAVTDWKQNAINGQTVAVPMAEGASAISTSLGTQRVQGGNAFKNMAEQGLSIPKPRTIPVASYQPKP